MEAQLQLKQVLPATFTSGNRGRDQKLGLGDLPGRWKCQGHGRNNRFQLPWQASACNVLLQPLFPPRPGIWLPVLKVSSDTAQSRFRQRLTSEQPNTELKRKPVFRTCGLHQVSPATACAGAQQAKTHLLLQDNFPRAWKANIDLLRHSREREIRLLVKTANTRSCISTEQ